MIFPSSWSSTISSWTYFKFDYPYKNYEYDGRYVIVFIYVNYNAIVSNCSILRIRRSHLIPINSDILKVIFSQILTRSFVFNFIYALIHWHLHHLDRVHVKRAKNIRFRSGIDDSFSLRWSFRFSSIPCVRHWTDLVIHWISESGLWTHARCLISSVRLNRSIFILLDFLRSTGVSSS